MGKNEPGFRILENEVFEVMGKDILKGTAVVTRIASVYQDMKVILYWPADEPVEHEILQLLHPGGREIRQGLTALPHQ
jgi:hypothetical protein